MSMADRIREARRRKKLTQREVAERFGITPEAVAQWEAKKDPTAPDPAKIPALAELLSESIDWLLTGERRQEVTPTPQAVTDALSSTGAWAKDVPVLGTTTGGAAGDFTLNVGDVVDYARRPPSLSRSSRVFVLYVQGTSMMRWREPGDAVYVDPIRPAKSGDRVVVECQPEREGEGHPAYLKELVGQTATKLRLKQYNPEGIIELPLAKVRKIHRVIEWRELFEA